MNTSQRPLRTIGLRATLACVLCLLISNGFAQPQPQTRFIVYFSEQTMQHCGAAAAAYIATHPNRSHPSLLTFSSYAAALQAARDMPCSGFDKIRLKETHRGDVYNVSAGLQLYERTATVVDVFETHEPSIADPITGHTYYDGVTVLGNYESRLDAACEDICTRVARGGTREFLTHVGADRWNCGCRVGTHGHPIYPISAVCPHLFQYQPVGGPPKSGYCKWLGGVTIHSVNVDPAKSIESSCRHVGNPIDAAQGTKIQVENDYRDPRGLLDVVRTYASSGLSTPTGWHVNWNARAGISRMLPTGFWSIAFLQSSARRTTFSVSSSSYAILRPDADVNDVLTASSTEIRLRRVRDGAVDHYDSVGKLIRRDFAYGGHVSLSYNVDPDNFRIDRVTVTDHWGQTVQLLLQSLTGRVLQARLPGDASITYGYDASGRITEATLPDGSRRLYHYNEPEHTAGTNLPIALTGISVQGTTGDPIRYSTYRYDALGRAISTEHAGGVNRYGVDYASAFQQSVVTDPRGSQRTLNLTTLVGNVLPLSQSQPAGSGCGPASSSITYDANANVTSRTDYNGQKTCYAYDLSRNVETKRIEGVPAATNCATALSNPPAGARVISTQWHPDWHMPTRVAEPKRITTSIYNGYGATCAPTTALVEGRPIAVVCSRSEQATTDESGISGLSAATTGAPRNWTYTYGSYGQLRTATDPNNRATSYTYYADDDPDLGKRGSVATITNAANHLTEITDYNAHGQPTRIVDPNGVVTALTYDMRQRLQTRTVGSELTRFDYNPATGRLTLAELPDGAALVYTYDDAHRLTAIADHKGNRIDYTLDAMGNRTAEQVRDPGGALTTNIARVMDALNRVERITGPMQ